MPVFLTTCKGDSPTKEQGVFKQRLHPVLNQLEATSQNGGRKSVTFVQYPSAFHSTHWDRLRAKFSKALTEPPCCHLYILSLCPGQSRSCAGAKISNPSLSVNQITISMRSIGICSRFPQELLLLVGKMSAHSSYFPPPARETR